MKIYSIIVLTLFMFMIFIVFFLWIIPGIKYKRNQNIVMQFELTQIEMLSLAVDSKGIEDSPYFNMNNGTIGTTIALEINQLFKPEYSDLTRMKIATKFHRKKIKELTQLFAKFQVLKEPL